MNTPTKLKPGEDRTWKTRRRAWLFGFAHESLFGVSVPQITDGESIRVYDVWDAGTSIPKGESESVKVQAWSSEASEFFLTIERTYGDLMKLGRMLGPKARMKQWAFWLEPVGDSGSNYRCRYVMRPNTMLADVLVLREKLERTTRGVFMIATQKHNIGALNEDVYTN